MRQQDPYEQQNMQLYKDLKHYMLLCSLGEICALVFSQTGWFTLAAFCAVHPASMIIVYLMTAPPCNKKGNTYLCYLMLTAISAVVIGMLICVYGIPKEAYNELTVRYFIKICLISFAVMLIGIQTQLYPLPPRKQQ